MKKSKHWVSHPFNNNKRPMSQFADSFFWMMTEKGVLDTIQEIHKQTEDMVYGQI